MDGNDETGCRCRTAFQRALCCLRLNEPGTLKTSTRLPTVQSAFLMTTVCRPGASTGAVVQVSECPSGATATGKHWTPPTKTRAFSRKFSPLSARETAVKGGGGSKVGLAAAITGG